MVFLEKKKKTAPFVIVFLIAHRSDSLLLLKTGGTLLWDGPQKVGFEGREVTQLSSV